MRIQPAAPGESLQRYSLRVSGRYETDYQAIQAQIAAGGGGGGGAVSSVFGRTGAVAPLSGDYAGIYQPVGSYLTTAPTITLTGDVTGSGSGSFAATLASVGTAGTYGNVTTDAKGRITAGTKGWEPIAFAVLGSAAATLIDTGATAFANYDFIRILVDVAGYSGSDTIAMTLNNAANSHQYHWVKESGHAAAGAAVSWLGATNQATNAANIKLAAEATTFARGIEVIIHNRPEATEKLVELRQVSGTNSTGTAPQKELGAASFITGASTRVTRIKLFTAGGTNLLAGTSCIIEGRNAA